eukprot:g3834.t1
MRVVRDAHFLCACSDEDRENKERAINNGHGGHHQTRNACKIVSAIAKSNKKTGMHKEAALNRFLNGLPVSWRFTFFCGLRKEAQQHEKGSGGLPTAFYEFIVVGDSFPNVKVTGKAKMKKVSSKEIARKQAAADARSGKRGGGGEGMAKRKERAVNMTCKICITPIHNLTIMKQHYDTKHPKEKWDPAIYS